MGKRILKIFGIVFGVAVAVFGAIIGVMALQGKFKKPYVEPTKLYFDLPYDATSKSYYMDVTYYCNKVDTKGEKKSNIYSFTLKSEPDNTTELDCSMAVESGSELIKFCDAEGNYLSNADMAKVKINKPVYFELSNEFDNDTENYAISNGVVKIYFNTSNNLCNGFLTINIDRQVSSVSLKDTTIKDSPNNVHKNGKFDFEKIVYEPIALTGKPDSWLGYYIQTTEGVYEQVGADDEFRSSEVYFTSHLNSTLELAISANDPYPLIPIYAPENSNQPFTTAEGKTCDIFIKNGNVYENVKTTTSEHIYLDNEGVYRFISSEPGSHEFYLITYPTYAIQKEAEEFFKNENNTDNIIFNNEFAISRKVIITVKNFGIQSVQFRNNNEVFNEGLDLFKDNYFVLDDDTLGEQYTNLEVSMFNNKGYEETSRLNQIKFYEGSDFVEGNIKLIASNIGSEGGKAQIILDGKNAILTNFGDTAIDGTRNYSLSLLDGNDDILGASEGTKYIMITIRFNDVDSDSLKLVFKVASRNSNGVMKLESQTSKIIPGLVSRIDENEKFSCHTTDFNLLAKESKNNLGEYVYEIGTIKVGSYLVFTDGNNNKNGLFEITSSGYSSSKVFKVLPKEKQSSLRLYLFVINEDYGCVFTQKYVTISVDPENTTYAKETEVDDLKIKYSKPNGELLIESSEIDVESLININTGSYRLPLMFVKDSNSEIKVETVGVIINKGGTTYRLVGYIKNGKFVNSIKPLEDKIGIQEIYTVIPIYSYDIKTSEELAEIYLRAGNYLDDNSGNNVEQVIDLNNENDKNKIFNSETFDNEGNIISINIKFAETIKDEGSSSLSFVGNVYKDSFEETNLISDEIYEIKEESNTHFFTVKIDDDSAFKESNLLDLFKGADTDNLLKLNEYFTLTINLYNDKNTLITSGLVEYEVNDEIEYSIRDNNKIINSYFKIISATFKEIDGTKYLIFEFNTLNDPTDSYVGNVTNVNGRDVINGYYFQLVFNYEDKSAVSSQLVVTSTKVTEYMIEIGGKQYSFNDYKIVYDVAWNNYNYNYSYSAYLKHKTDDTLPTIKLSDGTSLKDSNLLIDGEYIKAYPEYSSSDEYAYLAESSDNSVLKVENNIIEILKTGSANITLTNTHHTDTKTVIQVEIQTSSLKLVTDTNKQISDNELVISENGINYGDDNNSLVNRVIYTGDNKYLPVLKFSINSVTSGYYVKELMSDWSFSSIDGYIEYLQIKDNGYKLVASKPEGWDGINFAEANYYKLTDNGYEKITSAYTNFTLYTEVIDWETVDLATNYYFLDNGDGTYTRIERASIINPDDVPSIYVATPTWEDNKIYQRDNTVASLRLYEDNGSYQWKLVREENYVLTSIQFKLTANTLVGSSSVTYTYMSAVKIEKNAKNPMATDDVITYYKGTNLQVASKSSESDDDLETLFKLTNDTGTDDPTFVLQYRVYNENNTGIYESLGIEDVNLGIKGDSLTFEAENTTLQSLELNTVYQARIYYNDYKYYEFKFKMLENLLYNATTDNKENSISNPHVLTWGSDYVSIDLSEQIKYFEYDTNENYINYSTVNPKEVEGITYSALSEDVEYNDIITLSESTLSLGWVQFAGDKIYAIELTATGNNKPINVVYYVKVQSNFAINKIENLPDLKAYEEIDFDINDYFTIKNGSDNLSITKCVIENQYVKVNLTEKPELWTGYYVYKEGKFVAVEENANYDALEVYFKQANYLTYDHTEKTLVYNNQIGGELYFELKFTIDVDDGKEIKAVDESGNNVLYSITIENYTLPVKENAQLIGDGEANTSFSDLFDIDWDKVSQIDIEIIDQNINSQNSLTITSETADMLKLGAVSTVDSEFEAEIKITLAYVNGGSYEYNQKLKVVSAYYAEITYDFNDLTETIDSSSIVKLVAEEIKLPATMPFDIALTGETLDINEKFIVHKSLDDTKVENSKLETISLIGGIGFTDTDLRNITTSGTTITIGDLSNIGYLIFKASNSLTSCYYMVKVIPQNINASENYTTILTNNERVMVTKEFRVVGTEGSSVDSISAIQNITTESLTLTEIANSTGLTEDFLKDKEIRFYLTSCSGTIPYDESKNIKIGDKINDFALIEPTNPITINVAVVLINDIKIVHIMNYEITLLPNVKVTPNTNVDTNISTNYSNVEIVSTGNHYKYNLNVSYTYAETGASNEISIDNLFNVTDNVTDTERNIDLSEIEIIGLTNENSANINVVDNKLELLNNISENITFDLVLKYNGLEVTVHVTYKMFENTNTTRKYILGWDGRNSKFDYTLDLSELVPNYTGVYEGKISGDEHTYGDTTIDFSKFVATDAKIYKTLTITLTDIIGTPTYIFDIELDPSINVEINNGASVGDSIETIKNETESKLDVVVNVNTYTEIIIKDSKNIETAEDDVVFATIRLKDITNTLKLKYSYTTLDDVSYNEFIEDANIEILLETGSSAINFISSASDYSGILVLSVDKYEPIRLFVTVAKTYETNIQYPVSSESNESFVVGDNLTISEFINGNRFDYVAVDSSATWEEGKYYYFDKSSNKYLVVNNDYLFNRYRSYLYIYDDSDPDNPISTALSNTATYEDNYTYKYINNPIDVTLSNDSNNTNYIFSYLFDKHKTEYFVRNARTNLEVGLNTYVLITNEDVFVEYAIRSFELINDEDTFDNTLKSNIFKFEDDKYVLMEDSDVWQIDTYYAPVYTRIDEESVFNETTRSNIFKTTDYLTYSPITDEDVWLDYRKYDSETLEFTLITSISDFRTISSNVIYKRVNVNVNNERIVIDDTDILTTQDTLNTLQVEVYYKSAGNWILDSNKAYAEVTNNTIYFMQTGELKLVFFNGTGLNLEYLVNVETSDVNVDNITLNKEVSGHNEKDNIEYISTTLSELRKGFKLATLSYSPSDEYMFAMYCFNSGEGKNFIRINDGIIDFNNVKLQYYFENNFDLMLKTSVTALTSDYTYFDLYLITANGIVKTIRLYVTDVAVNLPSDLPEIWANTEGNKLSDNGLWITNGDTNKIDFTTGNYRIVYNGAFNHTDGIAISSTNRSIIDAKSSETFNLGGVEEEKTITLYYNLEYKVFDASKTEDTKDKDIYIVVKTIEFKIIVKNNAVIGGGNGFKQSDSNSFNGTIYLNNYEYYEYDNTNSVFVVDLMTKEEDSNDNYRDEYITYEDLAPLTAMKLNGESDNTMMAYISNYLKFEIMEDSYNTIKDDLSKPETLIENSEIDENGILKIKHDKNGTIKLKVTAKYSPNYYRIFNLNIRSTVDVYARYSETEYDENGYISGANYNLVTLDYDSVSAMFSLSTYETNSYYIDNRYTLSDNSILNNIKVKYAVHGDINTDLSSLAYTDVEPTIDNRTLKVKLPSVPMDGNYHFVTYMVEFTKNNTTQIYYCNIKVQNPADLELTTDYTTKEITVGVGASISNNLCLYNTISTGSLFMSASNIIKDATNKVKLSIYDNGNDASISKPKEVYFKIKTDGANYFINLKEGVLANTNGKVDFETTDETLKVTTLFSNSMSFDLVFVDVANKPLHTITGWTMKVTTTISPTNNKNLTDIFTVSELGQDLVGKKFSAVSKYDITEATEFNSEFEGYSISNSDEHVIEKYIERSNGDSYTIKSCIITSDTESSSFYNNSIKVYYIVSTQTKFIEFPVAYYISEIIDALPNEGDSHTIDLSQSLKVFDSSSWTSSIGCTIEENVEGDDIGATDATITITKEFLENLKASGKTSYSFDITVSGGGATRVFEVRIALTF